MTRLWVTNLTIGVCAKLKLLKAFTKIITGKGSPKFEVDVRRVKVRNNATNEEMEFGTAEEVLIKFGLIIGTIDYFSKLRLISV